MINKKIEFLHFLFVLYITCICHGNFFFSSVFSFVVLDSQFSSPFLPCHFLLFPFLYCFKRPTKLYRVNPSFGRKLKNNSTHSLCISSCVKEFANSIYGRSPRAEISSSWKFSTKRGICDTIFFLFSTNEHRRW